MDAEQALADYTFWLMLFTAGLVVATICLGVATLGLYVIGRKQLGVLVQGFNATHRPELTIREVGWEMVEMDGGYLPSDEAITFSLVNKGQTACTIVESAFEFRTDHPEGRALVPKNQNILGRIELRGGQFDYFRYPLTSETEGFAAGARSLTKESYFRGTIIYEDAAGTRRRLVFARVCPRDVDYFVRIASEDDEYND